LEGEGRHQALGARPAHILSLTLEEPLNPLIHASRRRSTIVAGSAATVLLAVTATSAIAAPTPVPAAPTKTTACAPAEGVTPTSITFGFVTPKTGPAAPNFNGAWQAAQLRIDQENAKGGVNGRKIKVIVYDDGSSPTTQISQANKAIQSDHVFGLGVNSSIDAMYTTLKQANVPVTGFSNLPLATDRNAFSATGVPLPSNFIGTSQLEKFKAEGATKLANINHASPGAANSGNLTSKAVQYVPGMTEVLRIADEPMGAHDATSTALRVKQSGADALTFVGFIEGGVSLAQALAQQGVKLKAFSVAGLTDPSVLKNLNGALEGAIGATYGSVPVGANVRAVKTFAAGMKAAGLNPYSAAAPMGYLAADLFIRGLKEAGKCPTRQLFIDKLRNVTNYDGGGLVPAKISFKQGITPNGNPAGCTWSLTAKGTDLVPDAKPTCGGKIIDTNTGKVVLTFDSTGKPIAS